VGLLPPRSTVVGACLRYCGPLLPGKSQSFFSSSCCPSRYVHLGYATCISYCLSSLRYCYCFAFRVHSSHVISALFYFPLALRKSIGYSSLTCSKYVFISTFLLVYYFAWLLTALGFRCSLPSYPYDIPPPLRLSVQVAL
jgi:hypothetical protein